MHVSLQQIPLQNAHGVFLKKIRNLLKATFVQHVTIDYKIISSKVHFERHEHVNRVRQRKQYIPSE